MNAAPTHEIRLALNGPGASHGASFDVVGTPAQALRLYEQIGNLIRAADLSRLAAFDALLAVAKAVDARGSHPDTWYGDAVEAMVALTDAHPGWREWAP